ncbi:MAG: hypothetical protein EXS11_02680 [Gemmataceae bacterium]|nr:hypothetical protein [Gemmataceae bacterium]
MVSNPLGSPVFQADAFLANLVSAMGADGFPAFDFVEPADLPQTPLQLLVHQHHMTVTLEAHYKAPLRLQVLERTQIGDAYTRRICLFETGTGKLVLYGVVRIHLNYCKPVVRLAILAEAEPLGRILLRHGVLTRIELLNLLRVRVENVPIHWFGPRESAVFGRIAVIHCDGKAAVELLELI